MNQLSTIVAGFSGAYPFSARMAEHLALQLILPPLVLLSLPKFKVSHAWFLKQPIFTWFAGLGSMWAWHDPALCNAAARHPSLQVLQLLSFVLVGAVFWWPIVAPDRSHRLAPLIGIIYLFTACLGCTILGIIITFAPAGLYLGSPLPGSFNDWQFASPEDQRIGGLLMWVPGCLVYMTGILGLMARWYGKAETPELHAQPKIS